MDLESLAKRRQTLAAGKWRRLPLQVGSVCVVMWIALFTYYVHKGEAWTFPDGMTAFCLTYLLFSAGFSLVLIAISIPLVMRAKRLNSMRPPVVCTLASGFAVGLLIGWLLSLSFVWRVTYAESLDADVSDAIKSIADGRHRLCDAKLSLEARSKLASVAESTLREIDAMLAKDSIWHLRFQVLDTSDLRWCLSDLESALRVALNDASWRHNTGVQRWADRDDQRAGAGLMTLHAARGRLTDLQRRFVQWRSLEALAYAVLLGAPICCLGLTALALPERTCDNRLEDAATTT